MCTIIIRDHSGILPPKTHVRTCAFGTHIGDISLQKYPDLATAPRDLANELALFSDDGNFEGGVYYFVKYEHHDDTPNGRALGGVTRFKGLRRVVVVTKNCLLH